MMHLLCLWLGCSSPEPAIVQQYDAETAFLTMTEEMMAPGYDWSKCETQPVPEGMVVRPNKILVCPTKNGPHAVGIW